MNGVTITLLILLTAIFIMLVILMFKKNGHGQASSPLSNSPDPTHQLIIDKLNSYEARDIATHAKIEASLSQMTNDHKEHKDELRSVSTSALQITNTQKQIVEILKEIKSS